MFASLTERTRRKVTALLKAIDEGRVYENEKYESYRRDGGVLTLVTGQVDKLFAARPTLITEGAWVFDESGSQRIWELTDAGKARLAEGGTR